MTKLNGSLTREIVAPDGKSYVVEIHNGGIYMREKGRRVTYGPVSWGFIFQKGAEMQVLAERREQQTTRAVKRFTRSLV